MYGEDFEGFRPEILNSATTVHRYVNSFEFQFLLHSVGLSAAVDRAKRSSFMQGFDRTKNVACAVSGLYRCDLAVKRGATMDRVSQLAASASSIAGNRGNKSLRRRMKK